MQIWELREEVSNLNSLLEDTSDYVKNVLKIKAALQKIHQCYEGWVSYDTKNHGAVICLDYRCPYNNSLFECNCAHYRGDQVSGCSRYKTDVRNRLKEELKEELADNS